MNKIVSTKTTSAIFLAIVLVLGTIAAISPYFLTVTAEAQSYYYDGMDNSYYKSQKDSSKSVLINKLKCINNNININGNNTGDINIGNKGQGYLGVSSSDGSGYGGGGYDGYKKDKDFECIINNNNTNTNIVTDGNKCAEDVEACFERFLTEEQFDLLSDALGSPTGITIETEGVDVTFRSFEDICLELEDNTFRELDNAIGDILEAIRVPTNPVDIIACIAEVLNIPAP